MTRISFKIFRIIIGFYFCSIAAFAQTNNEHLDVLSYSLKLEPDISNRSISGSETIRFLINTNSKAVAFDCGNLVIDSVDGNNVKSFHQENSKLLIDLTEVIEAEYEVTIRFHGKPQRGLVFLPESNQAYTVFHTSQWMVCNDLLKDKATIKMDLIIPDSLMGIGSGTFIGKSEIDSNQVMYSWEQELPVPSYTFGFAVGPFNLSVQGQNGTVLNFYSSSHSVIDLDSIFRETGSMMSYFEEVSGVKYYQDEYSQILIGSHYQEMAGFAVLRGFYGQMVLNDSTETNLISHELAHQWWGNAITCQSWNHFWLNEAFATFMSAAFNEHRFGRKKYMENINAYFDVYKRIKDKGADKPLVFEDWSNTTSDDRNIVYFKGAYVLHLLREELGDKKFWGGIKTYSQTYFGKSVITRDFQSAMEKSADASLDDFFDQWVYPK